MQGSIRHLFTCRHTLVRMAQLLCVLAFLCGALISTPGCSQNTPQEGNTPTDGGNTPDNATKDSGGNPRDNNTTPETPKDTAPPIPVACTLIFECTQKACKDAPTTACLESCAKDLGGDGKPRWEALQTCLKGQCASCQPNDTSCLQTCQDAKCGLPWVRCATDDQFGAGSCQDVTQCETSCNAGDLDCKAKCIAKANKEGQAAYLDFIECRGKAMRKELTAADEKACYTKRVRCLCPEHTPGSGSGTCKDYLDCINPCKADDACCVAKCRAALQAANVQPADQIVDCLVEKCSQCTDKACTDRCAIEHCNTPLVACLCPGTAAPGSGQKGCNEGSQCVQACSASDLCCISKCTADMSAGGYKKFEDVVRCIDTKCKCKEGDNSCIQQCTGLSGDCSEVAVNCGLD